MTSHHHWAIDLGSVAEWATAAVAFLALVAAVVSAVWAAKSASSANRANVLASEANVLTARAVEADELTRRIAQARFVYTTVEARWQVSKGDSSISFGELAMNFGPAQFVPVKQPDGSDVWVAQEELLHVVVKVHNASAELIGPIYLSFYEKDTGVDYRHAAGENLLPLLPDRSLTIGFSIPYVAGEYPLPVLRFRDSAGRWWSRRHFDPVEAAEPPIGM